MPLPRGTRPDGAADLEAGHGWVLRLWLVVLVFGAITACRSIAVGIPPRDPGGEILRSRLVLTIAIFLVLALLDAGRRSPRGHRTPGTVLRVLRARWPRRRLGLAAAGLLAYHAVYFCYHNLKSWDVFNAPRDAMLTRVDAWLFLGHSPAVLLHDVLGQHVATYVLMVVYESFPTIVSVSFVAAVVLVDRLRDGFVFLASAIWVWILGVGTYYLIPSLGPFHDRPQDFAGLPRTIVTDTQAKYMAQRAHLLAHPAAGDAFAQVSAFASLHVGVTCVILLMLRYYGLRIAARVMAVFLAATMVATIYLGWHFVVDDVAGVAIAVAAVWLGRLTIYPRGRRERDSPVPDATASAHPSPSPSITTSW
ncbi:phosphatase PAP2 family protein [Nocardioides sp.]|uniref:phosphatase PAP2 family protein n=1 Tax=Nocardioides sp. TaxID=35761 RepID=UPI0031FEF168|nr:PA-phosphatase [Nocardioides sp.]